MSEAKFTKGEWDIIGIDSSYAVLRRDTGYGICSTTMKEEQDLTNAHLIAAAPEMYNLLERLTSRDNCKKDIVHLLGEADNLLAKARGEK